MLLPCNLYHHPIQLKYIILQVVISSLSNRNICNYQLNPNLHCIPILFYYIIIFIIAEKSRKNREDISCFFKSKYPCCVYIQYTLKITLNVEALNVFSSSSTLLPSSFPCFLLFNCSMLGASATV